MEKQDNLEGIGEKETEPLELTGEMIERNDAIDNAVYDCILTLAEKDDTELPWDMEMIGTITDAIKSILSEYGVNVRHPGIVTEEKGAQYYAE